MIASKSGCFDVAECSNAFCVQQLVSNDYSDSDKYPSLLAGGVSETRFRRSKRSLFAGIGVESSAWNSRLNAIERAAASNVQCLFVSITEIAVGDFVSRHMDKIQ